MRRNILCGVLVVAVCGSERNLASEAYPGRQWEVRRAEEAGLAAEKLKAFSDYVGGLGCVVRHGYMVYAWGDASRRMDVASAAKPVYAHFLFKAVEDGRIAGFDEPVCKWEPRLARINAPLAHKDAKITWRHMANQVSCYGLVTEPLPNSIPRAGDKAAEMIPGQRSIGSQKIPDNQTDHMGSYSWLWWINGVDREGKRHWAGAPTDTFGCFGHGGVRAMIVLPSPDLIVSWNDARIDSREKENNALGLLVGAVSESKDAGSQSPRYQQAAANRARGRSFFMCGPGDPEDFLYRGTSNPDGTRSGDQVQVKAGDQTWDKPAAIGRETAVCIIRRVYTPDAR